jgi:hypothetical protein
MQIGNIGILAHVAAGKTSLTERLLYDTGAIDRLGSVEAGTTPDRHRRHPAPPWHHDLAPRRRRGDLHDPAWLVGSTMD